MLALHYTVAQRPRVSLPMSQPPLLMSWDDILGLGLALFSLVRVTALLRIPLVATTWLIYQE